MWYITLCYISLNGREPNRVRPLSIGFASSSLHDRLKNNTHDRAAILNFGDAVLHQLIGLWMQNENNYVFDNNLTCFFLMWYNFWF